MRKYKLFGKEYDTYKKSELKALLQELVNRGYNLGTFGVNKDGVDGNWGNVTEAAINEALKKEQNYSGMSPLVRKAAEKQESYNSWGGG